MAIYKKSVIMRIMVSIFDYKDYRIFLKDYYLEKKQLIRRFSYRYFAKKAGIKGQSYLDLVIQGKRNLTKITLEKFSRALELNKKEASYFDTLVHFNQAKNDDERNMYFEKLIKQNPRKGFSEIDKKRYLYFTNRHLITIREMVSLPHFEENPDWISQHMRHPLPPPKIIEAINLLIKMNLLKRDSQGKLRLSQGAVTTQPDFESLEALNYYHSIFQDAKEAIINIPFDKREAKSLTIPMSEKLIPKIKEKIQNFIEDIVRLVNNECDSFDDVYQVNTVFFPVTKTGGEKIK